MLINRQTCQDCGRTINANKYGGFTDITTQGFVCRDCFGQKLTTEDRDPDNYVQVPPRIRRPLIIVALLKIGLQIIFMQVGIESHDTVELVIALIFTAATLFWTVSPFLRWIDARKKEQLYQAWFIDVKKQARDRRAAREKEREEYRQIGCLCPHCGAYTTGRFCEYCGAPLK